MEARSSKKGSLENIITVKKEDTWTALFADDHASQLSITASFVISNANGSTCHAVAYFYDKDGIALKIDTENEYRAADGTLSSAVSFIPTSDNMDYVSSPLKIYLPYSVIPVPAGTVNLQYDLEIFDNKWNLVEKSGLQPFSFNLQ